MRRCFDPLSSISPHGLLLVPSKSSNPMAQIVRSSWSADHAAMMDQHCSHEQSLADHLSTPLSPTTPYTKRTKAFNDRDAAPPAVSLSYLTSNNTLYVHKHTKQLVAQSKHNYNTQTHLLQSVKHPGEWKVQRAMTAVSTTSRRPSSG